MPGRPGAPACMRPASSISTSSTGWRSSWPPAKLLGLRATGGIEVRAFLKEFSDSVIDSPGEPGVHYIAGSGIVKAPAAGTPGSRLPGLPARHGHGSQSPADRPHQRQAARHRPRLRQGRPARDLQRQRHGAAYHLRLRGQVACGPSRIPPPGGPIGPASACPSRSSRSGRRSGRSWRRRCAPSWPSAAASATCSPTPAPSRRWSRCTPGSRPAAACPWTPGSTAPPRAKPAGASCSSATAPTARCPSTSSRTATGTSRIPRRSASSWPTSRR